MLRLTLVLFLILNSPSLWALTEPEEESPPAPPVEINKWQFKSDLDNFTLEKTENRYTIGQREVNPVVFSDFEQIFSANTEYDVGCPHDLGKKPTVTITAYGSDNQPYVREFFVEKGYVRDRQNNKCLFIMKEGLTRLPLHRSWFIGQTNASLPIKNKLQVYYNGKLLYDFEKVNNNWQQNVKNLFINWEYFQRVLEAFKDFPIDQRYHPAIANEKKTFEIRTGREVYSFYLTGRNFWAAKIPKVNWLVASSAWALFEDFNPSLWLSRYHDQLLNLTNKDLPYAQRTSALQKLGDSWTPSIKQAFYQIMLDPDENNELKTRILTHIKQKPTTENMKILVKSLEQTEDLQLQQDISKVLRIMNPRGPLISLDEPEKNNEYIQQWKKWADSLK